MIRTVFFLRDGQFTGVELFGHAGGAPQGQNVVCAAVSSAVYMAANMLTDVVCVPVTLREEDGRFCIYLNDLQQGDPQAQMVLEGLWLHLTQLAAQYPRYIVIIKRRNHHD